VVSIRRGNKKSKQKSFLRARRRETSTKGKRVEEGEQKVYYGVVKGGAAPKATTFWVRRKGEGVA